MYTVYIVGASHGRRIGEALKRVSGYGTEFQVSFHCIGGKKFEELYWPSLKNIAENDLLIVVPFGNDLVERKFVFKNKGIIHLNHFVPRDNKHFDRLFQLLAAKISKTNCNVRILTNFYRHFCCRDHDHEGWLSYQNEVNRKIFSRFHTSGKIQVVDHRSLLPLNFKKAKDTKRYWALQTDSVHFADYTVLAEKIIRTLSVPPVRTGDPMRSVDRQGEDKKS
jgi:hypothetical protein